MILDGVPCFQVVFTLPDRLSRLTLGNRRALYDALFRASWAALKDVIEREQGFDPAALMMLHTWNQQLDAHAHVHAVVPGGGPALDGSGWRWSRREGSASSAGGYLVDAESLRTAFRTSFLRALNRLWKQGELKLEGEFAYLLDENHWRAWINELESIRWVSHIQPPPRDASGPQEVLKYLARYLTGGPISDRRILAADADQVTFLARAGTAHPRSHELLAHFARQPLQFPASLVAPSDKVQRPIYPSASCQRIDRNSLYSPGGAVQKPNRSHTYYGAKWPEI